ncbi:MAG: hypothetical protein PSY12_08980 [bacterium]|nr:hypothetical protein [bacterium]
MSAASAGVAARMRSGAGSGVGLAAIFFEGVCVCPVERPFHASLSSLSLPVWRVLAWRQPMPSKC